MQQSLKAFVEGFQFEPVDSYAQRAIIAQRTLARFVGNAYIRGDAEAFDRCQEAQNATFIGFALAHRIRKYAFASEISPQIDAVVASLIDVGDPLLEAASLVETAEREIEALKRRCAPTYSVQGLTNVAILRGAHCTHAVTGLRAHNDNKAA